MALLLYTKSKNMESKQFRSCFAEIRCQTRPVDDDLAEPATKDYINCLEDEEETTFCRNLLCAESHVKFKCRNLNKCEVSSNVYTFITPGGRLIHIISTCFN